MKLSYSTKQGTYSAQNRHISRFRLKGSIALKLKDKNRDILVFTHTTVPEGFST